MSVAKIGVGEQHVQKTVDIDKVKIKRAVTDVTIKNCFEKAFKHCSFDKTQNDTNVHSDIEVPQNMTRSDFEAAIEIQGENEEIHCTEVPGTENEQECEIEEEQDQEQVPVESISTVEVLKALRVVQNWGQLEGFPNYPGGMESLLKIENSIMLKKFQKVSVQK